jgi:hypothetical protein
MESEAGLSHMHGTSCGNLGRQWAKSRLQPRDYKPRMRPFALTMAVFDLAQSRAAANAPFKAHAFSSMRAMNQLDLGEQAAHIAVEAKKCLFAGNERRSEACKIAFRSSPAHPVNHYDAAFVIGPAGHAIEAIYNEPGA